QNLGRRRRLERGRAIGFRLPERERDEPGGRNGKDRARAAAAARRHALIEQMEDPVLKPVLEIRRRLEIRQLAHEPEPLPHHPVIPCTALAAREMHLEPLPYLLRKRTIKILRVKRQTLLASHGKSPFDSEVLHWPALQPYGRLPYAFRSRLFLRTQRGILLVPSRPGSAPAGGWEKGSGPAGAAALGRMSW